MATDAGTLAGYPDPCVICDPGAMPDEFRGARIEDGRTHVAVRFGDAAKGTRIYLEGYDITYDTVEAIDGEHGLVLITDRWNVHRHHIEHLVRRGRVAIELPEVTAHKLAPGAVSR